MSLHWIAWVGISLYALAWGSFLNAMGYRLGSKDGPYSRAFVKGNPRSSCWSCSHPLAWYDNIPILSWLVARGHCRYCQVDIPSVYILGEATFLIIIPTVLFVSQSVPITLILGGLLSCLWLSFLKEFWRKRLHQKWLRSIMTVVISQSK